MATVYVKELSGTYLQTGNSSKDNGKIVIKANEDNSMTFAGTSDDKEGDGNPLWTNAGEGKQSTEITTHIDIDWHNTSRNDGKGQIHGVIVDVDTIQVEPHKPTRVGDYYGGTLWKRVKDEEAG